MLWRHYQHILSLMILLYIHMYRHALPEK